jgi:predicted amino acid dehydrogenase
MLRLPPQSVYDKIVRAGRLAQMQGARILGLGGLTSAVGDGGVTISQRLNMPVTTGNSLTVGLAVETLRELSEEQGLAMDGAVAAVIGAPGTIGLACAEMLAPRVRKLILVGGQKIWLSQARALTEAAGARKVEAATSIDAVMDADAVLGTTSAYHPLLHPRHLKRNSVVCDVALPSIVSSAVTGQRTDVAVIKGAVVKVPGPVSLGFNLGLPAGQVFACMAEVMVLALESRYEAFSLGKRVHREKVREITRLARKHGFQLAAWASSEDEDDD